MNGQQLAEYNSKILAEWTMLITQDHAKILFAVSIDDLSRMQLYVVRGLNPLQIAEQLESIARKLKDNSIDLKRA